MSAVDIETFKTHADEFVAKAIAGEPTIIEQHGKRAVILPCAEGSADFELNPKTDELLLARIQSPGRASTPEDWASLRARVQPK